MSKIGYIRVSTEHQETARQQEIMCSYQVDRIFSEKLSGANTDRPQLRAMLDYVREGDTLYIESISRLGRSTKGLLNIIDTLTAKGVTLISQITAVADFYETATHGKLSYKVLVMIVPIVTTIVASFGLDTIVSLTSPWFSFFYPITLVMTILGIFEKKIPNDGAFKGAVYFTVIYAVLDLPHEYGFGFLDPVLNHIPLYGLGFGWIVPAIVGFIVGLIVWKGKGRTET